MPAFDAALELRLRFFLRDFLDAIFFSCSARVLFSAAVDGTFEKGRAGCIWRSISSPCRLNVLFARRMFGDHFPVEATHPGTDISHNDDYSVPLTKNSANPPLQDTPTRLECYTKYLFSSPFLLLTQTD